MHGGASGSGAPLGKRNGAYRTGEFTKNATKAKQAIAELIKLSRATLSDCE
jgi:hypothetical protein